ncbi:LysR family transcriptional regulator [Ferrimonas balearica]|uniref:LysR family transcriptional regulator n=1 Tax=Ferrimonas balearica TaxID=44012 RepID=UPI001C99028A|nr:LysR family transcriptional regulator [Ferrimonas balearica]MBY5920110.1 LysR family transcriptional regulator [Ferrimonas balearica]MBY5997205.1 LysR family transcriptional regulator [Ferrimonas balearica]
MPKTRRHTLQDIELLTALVKTRSLTETAGYLGISVPAVSQALDKLRERVGDPLLIRDGRGMTPTALASRVAESAETHLNELTDLHRNLIASGNRDTLDIAFPPAYEALLLDALLECDRRPDDLTIHCAELDTNDYLQEGSRVMELLGKRQLDIALVLYPIEDPRFHCIKVIEDQIVVLHRKGHPRIREMDAETYYAEEHVAWKMAFYRQAWQRMAGIQLEERRIGAVISDSFSLGNIASKSDLIASAPESLARRWMKSLPLEMKPFPFKHRPISTYLVYHKAYARPELARWVQDACESLSQ